MAGYWHITYAKDGKRIQSTDHRSKRDAETYAEIEGADAVVSILNTARPLRSALAPARRRR